MCQLPTQLEIKIKTHTEFRIGKFCEHKSLYLICRQPDFERWICGEIVRAQYIVA